MGSLIRHAGTWTIEDMMASPVHYLPVEVGPGTAALRVTLSYPRDGGAGARPRLLRAVGFSRLVGGRAVVVRRSRPAGATPGYLPGEVTAGLWQVAIGLYRVPAEGVGYEVTAESIGAAERRMAGRGAGGGRAGARGGAWSAARAGAAGLQRTCRARATGGAGGSFGPVAVPVPLGSAGATRAACRPGAAWLAGDLHAHTVHSDGAMTVPELAAHAVSRGLDFVAVTDHNTVSHHRELASASAAYGVTLLPGQEVTTSRGHAGVLGDTGWIDFRTSADAWLDAAERGGGLMSVNHPFAGDVSWLHSMTRRPPLLEVWHWSWLDPTWTTPLSWWQAWDPVGDPGRRQRLAPAGLRLPAGHADDLGGVRRRRG